MKFMRSANGLGSNEPEEAHQEKDRSASPAGMAFHGLWINLKRAETLGPIRALFGL